MGARSAEVKSGVADFFGEKQVMNELHLLGGGGGQRGALSNEILSKKAERARNRTASGGGAKGQEGGRAGGGGAVLRLTIGGVGVKREKVGFFALCLGHKRRKTRQFHFGRRLGSGRSHGGDWRHEP